MAAELNTTTTNASEELGKRARDEPELHEQQLIHAQGQQELLACVTCTASDVKYRCPRCERVTCSLACCLDHKKTYECDGKRDRTKYVALKQFSDANLSSDFFFLEEVARSANSAARSRSQLGVEARQYGQKKRKTSKKKQTNIVSTGQAINPHVPSDWLTRFPVPFQILVQHAAKRGVALTLLAPGMSKRVRNTSHMDARKEQLFWRVEWSFPHADTAVSLFEKRASDAQTPFALLAQYLTKSPENATIRGKLRKYAMANWQEHVLLLLRKEFTSASEPQFYRLDGNLSLESNLKRKAVVEFPVIIVALREDAAQYPVARDRIEIVSADDEESGEDEDSASDEEENGEGDVKDDNGEEMSVEEDTAGEAEDVSGYTEELLADNDGVEMEVLGHSMMLFDDESSVDDLLPSIAEADDELLMFGENVNGVDFLNKQPFLAADPPVAAAARGVLIEELASEN